MTCQRCGTTLAPNRTRLCSSCGFRESKSGALPDGGDVYHKASSPAASNIARHIQGIRQHFSVPEDKSDLRALSDFTQAVRDHDLTQTELIDELHALREEYQDRFPAETREGIEYNPVEFEIRHALQWAETYPGRSTTIEAEEDESEVRADGGVLDGQAETQQCEGLTCSNDVAYVFYCDLGTETEICEEHAADITEDKLEPIEVVR